MYRCTNCTNTHTTNRAMLWYSLKHQGKLYGCSRCPKQCDSLYNLSQHIKGYHGDGWLLPCGEREQWPSLVQKHKKKCGNCKLIKEKKSKKNSEKWSKLDIRRNRITVQLLHNYLQF